MYLIEKTTNNKIIKSIITHKELYKRTYGQNTNRTNYNVESDWKYYLIQDFSNIIGVIQVRDVSKVTVEVHPFILPKYWNKNISTNAIKSVHNYFKQLGYLNVLSSAPSNCIYALKFADKMGYKVCGMIKDGVVYNNYLVSLILYNYPL